MGRSSESTAPAAGPRATEAGYKPKDENETKRTQRARGLSALVVVIVGAHLPLLASLAGPQKKLTHHRLGGEDYQDPGGVRRIYP